MRWTPLLVLSLGTLACSAARAQDLKSLEQQLKTDYEGKLVRLNYPAAVPGFRIELSRSERKSLQPHGRAYLRVETVKLEKNEVEFGARRATFYLDLDNKQREFAGPAQTYRLRWEDKNADETKLQEALARLLPLRDAIDEDWAAYWASYTQDNAAAEPDLMKPRDAVVQGVYRVGGGVTAPVCEYCPDPEYPDEMRAGRNPGIVVFWCILTEDGQPVGIRLYKSAGEQFDNAAAYALMRWRLKPATREGRPVPVAIAMEVHFNPF